MWIMIAGPYTTGAVTEQDRTRNLDALNAAALAVFQKGHIPIIGVNLALPIISLAGTEKFDDIMMPISLAVAERCDACLRIGGSSEGADQEVAEFERKGRAVFSHC